MCYSISNSFKAQNFSGAAPTHTTSVFYLFHM